MLSSFDVLQEIDESHACFSMKYLKNKPVRDLKDEQYLKLVTVSPS